MPILGTRAHEALIAVLVIARESAGLTQREVIPRLPPWLGWRQPTLAKIEKGRRVIAFEEVQALCEAYGSNIATIELQAAAYESAMSHTTRVKPPTTAKARRKR